MDCHEPHSHFELVGIFKETDGLVDWAEQLFKHQGYCIWGEDEYEVMSEAREQLPSYCIQLYYPDDDGNTLYHHIQPEKEGNISLGIYSDEDCTQISYTTYVVFVSRESSNVPWAKTKSNSFPLLFLSFSFFPGQLLLRLCGDLVHQLLLWKFQSSRVCH